MPTARVRRISWFDRLVELALEKRMVLMEPQLGVILVDPWELPEEGESGQLRYVIATIRGFSEPHWRNIIIQIAPQKPFANRPWTIGKADFVIAVMNMFDKPAALSKRMRGDLKTLLDRIYNKRPDFDVNTILGLVGIHCFTLARHHGLVKSPSASTTAEAGSA